MIGAVRSWFLPRLSNTMPLCLTGRLAVAFCVSSSRLLTPRAGLERLRRVSKSMFAPSKAPPLESNDASQFETQIPNCNFAPATVADRRSYLPGAHLAATVAGGQWSWTGHEEVCEGHIMYLHSSVWRIKSTGFMGYETRRPPGDSWPVPID